MYLYRLALAIWLATAALAAAALAAPARSQVLPPPSARVQEEQRLTRRLDPKTRDTVMAIIESARAAGLPTAPLADRALEGASKGASGSAIVSAVRALAGDLRTARDALGPRSSVAELTAAASALRLGVQTDALAELRRARVRGSLTVPIAVLADLAAGGVHPDSATAAVQKLARTPADDDAFVAFRQNVERDIALGAPPNAAASFRVNSAAREAMGFTTMDAGNLPGNQAAPRPRKP